jgi:phosphatidylglycerophosphate synthase
MVAAALIVLVQLGRLDAILAMIIIGREITISALREWMARIGAHKSVAVSMIGKIKTTAQMIAIPMLLYYAPLRGRRLRTRHLADLRRGRADPLVDGLLHANGLAAPDRRGPQALIGSRRARRKKALTAMGRPL